LLTKSYRATRLSSPKVPFLSETQFAGERGNICGVDEAGRGPLAGPLSLSLVCFATDTLSKVHSGDLLCGLTDSKKLSPSKRESLYAEILQVAGTVSHVFVSNRFIDRFGLSLSIYAGISSLVRSSNLDDPFLLIDGNYSFRKHELEYGFSFDYRSIVKGDSKVASISAASVVAKVKRDNWMIDRSLQFPEYHFEKHKGYGTKQHYEAIQKFGVTKLHRKSFLANPGLFDACF
jgi:ribonuclease HII